MDKLKLIKTIVFILTFLLIFGTLMLLGSIFKKTHSAATPLPQAISLEQPIGSNLEQIAEKNNNLYLLVRDGGLPDRVIIFDTQTGKTLSTISLY